MGIKNTPIQVQEICDIIHLGDDYICLLYTSIGVDPANAVALEDAPSGIRSAVSAGMRAIMVPDLVEPDEKILEMAWHRFDTLFDVLRLLQEG